jgi:hypothetical protein
MPRIRLITKSKCQRMDGRWLAFHREEINQEICLSYLPEPVIRIAEYSVVRQDVWYPSISLTCAASNLARESRKGHNKPIVTGVDGAW